MSSHEASGAFIMQYRTAKSFKLYVQGLTLYAEESLNVMKYFGMAKMALRRNSMLVWRTESTCPWGMRKRRVCRYASASCIPTAKSLKSSRISSRLAQFTRHANCRPYWAAKAKRQKQKLVVSIYFYSNSSCMGAERCACRWNGRSLSILL